VEGVSVRLEVHVAASMRVRFHPILPTISVGLDRLLNQIAQNTGFSATTNSCDSSRSKVKWWEIAESLIEP
jgi:hypothetical protein